MSNHYHRHQEPRRQGTLRAIGDKIYDEQSQPVGFKARSFMSPPEPIIDERVSNGKIYMLNNNYLGFYAIDTRSRWQHFTDWLKRKLRRRDDEMR